MPNTKTTKSARQAAREAVSAAQEELARRTKANADDLTTYFTARDRVDAIDETTKSKIQALQDQANERQAAERVKCGAALRAMRDRGEAIAEIAQMAGTSVKVVRELIAVAEQAGDQAPEAGHQEAVPQPAKHAGPEKAADDTDEAAEQPVAPTLVAAAVHAAAV